MNQEKRYFLVASLTFCVFSLILQLDKCSAVDPQFVACYPVNCRYGPNISFPFYIQHEQESYCGYPGFGLNCNEQGFPVVHIAGNEYIVEHISYQNHTFELKNSVFNSNISNGCVSEIKNVSLDNRPFRFVNESRIYLLSKCNISIPKHLWKHRIDFGCGEENGNDWGIAMFAKDESFESALQVCKNHVMVPVEMLGDEGRGFRLSWTSSNCSECAESGGRCGFDVTDYQFKCFCTDRPHSSSCQPTTAKRNLGLILGTVFSCIGILILLFCFRKRIFWLKNLRNLGGVSHKSDVYSYGMMVLEMVGGRKNVDVGVDRTSEIYFPHWLYQRIELDEELQLIGIMNEEENECARKMVIASLWCIQTDPSNRPAMTKVVEMLEGNLDSLQIPPKPYLYSPSTTEADSSVVELT
ncbi:hypothetical protein HAX54_026079 [Datura stramonium]|uniref:non-specific serine/threonine protein kinase n=1 Tax=Datura stramonium TaxID=4076 RepID=A0ABS8S6N1_DATST|nr:hypothetical protein [Datura stramonium]